MRASDDSGAHWFAWILVALSLSLPVKSYHGAAGIFESNVGEVKGSGNDAYFRVTPFWEYGDGVVDVKVPTVEELKAAGMDVTQNQTEFTLTLHVKNSATGAELFLMAPEGYDWSEAAKKNMPTCIMGYAYPSTGWSIFGNDCHAFASGPACQMYDEYTKWTAVGNTMIQDTESADVRQGMHLAFVKKAGSATIEYYRNGKHVLSYTRTGPILPFLCFGGHVRLQDVNGFIRDFRVYPRALVDSEIFDISESCDGLKEEVLDDPSLGFTEKGTKTGKSCSDYNSDLSNGFISTCPADATARCPVTCGEQPVCAPPKKVEHLDLKIKVGPQTLCLNTQGGFNINELVDRCKTLSPYNETWAKGGWPSVDAGRRLGHIPNPMCPGATSELDPLKDFRVVHNPACDFDGSALRSVMSGKSFTLWFWSYRQDAPGIFSFYHSMARPGPGNHVRRSGIYSFEFQDDRVWVWPNGTTSESGAIAVKYIEPAYIKDPDTGIGNPRWVFRALISDGGNTTYIIDGDHKTWEYHPGVNQLEAMWFSHGKGPNGTRIGPTNISGFSFIATALTIQQIQQIYYLESVGYRICPPGQFHDKENNNGCGKCIPGTFADEEGLTECKQCKAGYEALMSEARMCTPCRPGSFSVAGSACQPCEPGYASNVWNASSCAVCTAGKYASNYSSTECDNCPLGKYAPGIQADSCFVCVPGRYAAEEASIACQPCKIGTYQPNDQSSECLKCNATWVTDSQGSTSTEDCTCPAGSYLNRETNTCEDCGPLVGYSCPGGLAVPLVTNGFYALPVGNVSGVPGSAGSFSRMQVWRCVVEDNCKGDRPMAFCPPNMEGPGCSVCADGYVRSNDLLACESCEEAGGYIIFAFFMLGLFPAVYVLCFFNRTRYQPTVASKVILIGIVSVMITFLQFVVIIVEMKPDWPMWLRTLSDDYAGFFMMDTSFAKPACALGEGLLSRMFAKLMAPFVLMAALAFDFFCIHAVAAKILPRHTPDLGTPDILNGCGLFLQALFVMTCKTTFAFIECTKHPSAPRTLISYPSVECGSDEHMKATPLFVAGLLIHVVGVWSLLLFLNWKAMYLFHDSLRRRIWRRVLGFLVGKWEPSRWYWGQIYLTRNLLLSLVVVVEPDDGYFQCFMFVVLLALPGFATALRRPWRHRFNNQVDCCITPLLLLIAISGIAFVPPDQMVRSKDLSSACMKVCFAVAFGICLIFVAKLAFDFATGRNPEKTEVKRIDALATAVLFQAKYVDALAEVNREGLTKFIASIEPTERQRAQDFCMLMDAMLLKDAIKACIERSAKENAEEAYIPHVPNRIKRSNSFTEDQQMPRTTMVADDIGLQIRQMSSKNSTMKTSTIKNSTIKNSTRQNSTRQPSTMQVPAASIKSDVYEIQQFSSTKEDEIKEDQILQLSPTNEDPPMLTTI